LGETDHSPRLDWTLCFAQNAEATTRLVRKDSELVREEWAGLKVYNPYTMPKWFRKNLLSPVYPAE
jgi:hypothetical protein